MKRVHKPFSYPEKAHIRKHGPMGYRTYESYREWLRDEFTFRCVFCLERELWGQQLGEWEIDHFMPQVIAPSQILDYDNLLYLCNTCNSIKSNNLIPDPCKIALGDCLRVEKDGQITALNKTGKLIIKNLRLDSTNRTRYRKLLINTFDSLLANNDISTFIEWMKFPDDLPDLSSLRPIKGNSRPEGIDQSFYVLRSQNKLPETY